MQRQKTLNISFSGKPKRGSRSHSKGESSFEAERLSSNQNSRKPSLDPITIQGPVHPESAPLKNRLNLTGINPLVPSIPCEIDNHNNGRLATKFKNKLYATAAMPQSEAYKAIKKQMAAAALDNSVLNGTTQPSNLFSFTQPNVPNGPKRLKTRPPSTDKTITSNFMAANSPMQQETLKSFDKSLALNIPQDEVPVSNRRTPKETPRSHSKETGNKTFRISRGNSPSRQQQREKSPKGGGGPEAFRTVDMERNMDNAYKLIQKLKGSIDISKDIDRFKHLQKPKSSKKQLNSDFVKIKDIDEIIQIAGEENVLNGMREQDQENEMLARGRLFEAEEFDADRKDIDAFIQLIKAKKISASEFIYMIKKSTNDSYNLKPCDFSYLQKFKFNLYFTLSMNGITRFENNIPVEHMTLSEWLKEREIFNTLKVLAFFKKFRGWKTLQRWKKSVARFKRMNYTSQLRDRLFMTNNKYQKTLLTHMDYCHKITNLRIIGVNVVSNNSDQKVPRLKEFDEAQRHHRERLKETLKGLSEEMHKNNMDNISQIIAGIKGIVYSQLSAEETAQKLREGRTKANQVMGPAALSANVNDPNEKKNCYTELGFPETLNYGHRTMLREEIMNFLRFAYLLDYTVLSALTQVYISTAKEVLFEVMEMEKSLESQIKIETEMKKVAVTLKNKPPAKNAPGKLIQQHFFKQMKAESSPPLFSISLVFNPRISIDSGLVSSQEIGITVDKIEDFDFNMNCYYDAEVNIEEVINNIRADFAAKKKKPTTSDMRDRLARYELQTDPREGLPREKRFVKDLYTSWLSFSPSITQITSYFNEWFSSGLSALLNVERWSKHPEYGKYLDALEEWDEKIGNDWSDPESIYINPKNCVKDHPIYDIVSTKIQKALSFCFDYAISVSKSMDTYIQDYWLNNNTELNRLSDTKLKYSADMINMLFQLFKLQEKRFTEGIPEEKNAGIFHLNLKDFREGMIPQPAHMKKKLQKLLPSIYKRRLREIKEWGDKSVKLITTAVLGMEEFIQERNESLKISFMFQWYRESLTMAMLYLSAMAENEVPISKELKNLYNEVYSIISSITSGLLDADTRAEHSIAMFTAQTKQKIGKLKDECEGILVEVYNECFLKAGANVAQMTEKIEGLNKSLLVIEEKAAKYAEHERFLEEKSPEPFEFVTNLRSELDSRLSLWRTIGDWESFYSKISDELLKYLPLKERTAEVDCFFKTVIKLERVLPRNNIIGPLKEKVTMFKELMPVLASLRSLALKDNHWREINKLTGTVGAVKDFRHESDFTIKDLVKLRLLRFGEEILSITSRATQEGILLDKIVKMEQKWKTVDIPIRPYKESKDMYYFGEMEELFNEVDEGLSSINSILANRYVKPFKPKAEVLQSMFFAFQENVDKWMDCQKKWLYLGNIYTSSDIKKSIGEGSLFDTADKLIRQLYKKALMTPQIAKFVKISNLGETLTRISGIFDVIEKHLEVFLETKRKSFPRLYFLSNDEVVEILSKVTINPECIQPFLIKMFDNIAKISINPENKLNIIETMVSSEGEVIPFNKPNLMSRGNVEVWLDALQRAMAETVVRLIKEALINYVTKVQKTRIEWALAHYSQPVTLVQAINWSHHTEQAVNSATEDQTALETHQAKHIADLLEITKKLKTSEKIDPIQRRTLVYMIIQDVHFRDINQKLISEDIFSVDDFLWQQQLRYYWIESLNQCHIKQMVANFIYGNEYEGPTSRLVITPLTERCWITITSALGMSMGTAPSGPAGTGKTESTKDLAKALGLLCVVYNCTNQVTSSMMIRLFAGLLQQGVWACLDEFNRINVEVLSVIAQQLLEIRLALLAGKPECNFEGKILPLKSSFGVFITMNPSYAGRTELPDNLKTLFRQVSMMIPDYSIIAEIMLYAEGFENASSLSVKLVQLNKLSSEQLSSQSHYDFGMRSMKAVLVMAGKIMRKKAMEIENIKREAVKKKLKLSELELPEIDEEEVLVKAMKQANNPKFLSEDLPLFEALIEDLFPDKKVKSNQEKNLKEAVAKAFQSLELIQSEEFANKVYELLEVMYVRFGVMVVGNEGTGKTKVWELLQSSLSFLNQMIIEEGSNEPADPMIQDVHTYVLNPKYLSMGELYGDIDRVSGEWRDGLAAWTIRRANDLEVWTESMSSHRQWIIFDGPVDVIWIENMNSVLDDNKLLCLANGQRIKLREEIQMLFEVSDLRMASPATVSRCGMVYMKEDTLKWDQIVKTWVRFKLIHKLPPSMHKSLLVHTNNVLCSSLANSFSNKRFPMTFTLTISHSQITRSVLRLFETFLGDDYNILEEETMQEDSTGKPRNASAHLLDATEDEETLKHKLTLVSAFCVLWAFGGTTDPDQFDKLDMLMRDSFRSISIPSVKNPFDIGISLLADGYFYSLEGEVPDYHHFQGVGFNSIFVETIDSVKVTNALKLLAKNNIPVLLTGKAGVGKTALAKSLKGKLSSEIVYNSLSLTFSSKTPSSQIQGLLDAKLIKKGKNKFGAKPNNKYILFIDDFHMPSPELFGAQPPLEFMRFLLDKGGYYDLNKFFFKHVEDLWTLAVASYGEGLENCLPRRLLSHFFVVTLNTASDSKVEGIFGVIVKGFFFNGKFSESVLETSEKIIPILIGLFHEVHLNLLPTPSRFHYLFSMRDIARMVEGILQARPNAIPSSSDLAKLLAHEAMRVFGDRLSFEEDRNWLLSSVARVIGEKTEIHLTIEEIRTVVFSGLVKMNMDRGSYEQVSSMALVEKELMMRLEEFNFDHSGELKEYVFFKEAIEHLLRIIRVLQTIKGNMLIIGNSGCGKRSAVKLGAFICQCKTMAISLGSSEGNGKPSNQRDFFRNQLLQVVKSSGISFEKTMLLVTDKLLKDDNAMEDLNILMNTGDVPGLFKKREDLEELLSKLSPLAENRGKNMDPDDIYELYLEELRKNLHVIICASPLEQGKSKTGLRFACRKYPALISCTTLDWFSEWPRNALVSVAEQILLNSLLVDPRSPTPLMLNQGDEGGESPSEKPKKESSFKLADVLTSTSELVKTVSEEFSKFAKTKINFTSKSFLDFVKFTNQFMEIQSLQRENMMMKLSQGIEQLLLANKSVVELEKKLEQFAPELEEQNRKTAEYMTTLTEETNYINSKERQLEEETVGVELQAKNVKVLSDEAEAEFKRILPILQEADNGLASFPVSEITEIKRYNQPPAIVEMVMGAVCTLLGEGTDWASIKSVMTDSDFVNRLKRMDKNAVPPERAKKLKTYVLKPEFDPIYVGSKSMACKAMCIFCRAIDRYITVLKEVEPKKKKMEELSKELNKKYSELNAKRADLNTTRDKLTKLRGECDSTATRKQEIEDEIELSQNRLKRASVLKDLLSEEGTRWKEKVALINDERRFLLGNVILSSLYINYGAPFPTLYRSKLQDIWEELIDQKGIPVSEKFNFAEFLHEPGILRIWQIQGLPSDSNSKNSAAILLASKKTPFIVDPQNQAMNWVYEHFQEKGELVETNISDPNYLKKLELAIESGQAFVLSGINHQIPHVLDSVVQKQTQEMDGRLVVKLGEELVEFNSSFFLILSTQLENVSYSPEMSSEVTIINFSVTFDGLQAQLLTHVIQNEDAELEAKRDRLVAEVSSMNLKLIQLQQTILDILVDFKGFILDNEELIETLSISKTSGEEVKSKLSQSSSLEKDLEAQRERFTGVSVFGSACFFLVKQLELLKDIYRFSLEFFVEWFKAGLKGTSSTSLSRKEGEKGRIKDLKRSVANIVYTEVSSGLFSVDRRIFAFSLAILLLQSSGKITSPVWKHFLKGPESMAASSANPSPDPVAVPEKQWTFIYNLSRIYEPLKGVSVDLKINLEDWKPFLQTLTPWERDTLPIRYRTISAFSLLVLTRAFHSRFLFEGVSQFLNDYLAKYVTLESVYSLSKIYQKVQSHIPLILILSPGTDPTNSLIKLASDEHMENEFYPLSLGQGISQRAEMVIQYSMVRGGFIALQNCHLASSWMKTLFSIVDKMKSQEIRMSNMEFEILNRAGSLNSALNKLEAIANAVEGETSAKNQSEEEQKVIPIHPKFRLILTTMPVQCIPDQVVSSSIKLTTEPPKGVRANVFQAFKDFSGNEYAPSMKKMQKIWPRILYSTCLFHAVVQERRKFGSMGFNVVYEFSQNDLEVSLSFLKMFCEKALDEEDLPFDAIQFLVGDIIYGGRVTDEMDRKLLKTLLKVFVNQESFLKTEEKYAFLEIESYSLPKNGSLHEIQETIKNLPTSDTPKIFGMHENAEISLLTRESRFLIESIVENSTLEEFPIRAAPFVDNQRVSEGNSGSLKTQNNVKRLSLKEVVAQTQQEHQTWEEKALIAVKSYEKQLPVKILKTSVSRRHIDPSGELGVRGPLSVFILQEMEKFNFLLDTIKNSLGAISKAISGHAMMSDELEELGNSIIFGKIPQLWLNYSYETRKSLASWFNDLIARVEYLRLWLTGDDPKCFWISAFFFPQGFVTCLLQLQARLNHVSVDSIKFKFKVMSIDESLVVTEPKDGYYVYGLYMEGAKYDTGPDCLVDQRIGEVVHRMNVVHFLPMMDQYEPSDKDYACPLYKTMERSGVLSTTGISSNYILSIVNFLLASSNKPLFYLETALATRKT